MSATNFLYAAKRQVPIYKAPNLDSKKVNTILMGTYVEVLEENGEWLKINTIGRDGWAKKSDFSEDMGLKVFFIDVGQGDGMLIEFAGKRMIVDGGQGANVKNYLTKWHYTYLLNRGEKVHFDYIFVTHFDSDHFYGLIELLSDNRISIGTIYHPGIGKFKGYATELGTTLAIGKEKYLETTFSTLADLEAICGEKDDMIHFTRAAVRAFKEGRLEKLERATHDTPTLTFSSFGKELTIEFLGPIRRETGYRFKGEYSQVINGNCLVLKLKYDEISILLSGDLNKAYQKILKSQYKGENPFEADVHKAPHHGSSDQDLAFLKMVNPYATIISSGDNEVHTHPRPDAIGAFAKYGKGERPWILITELARSVNDGKILYGMINLRTDGKQLHLSQMKESKSKTNPWVTFDIFKYKDSPLLPIR